MHRAPDRVGYARRRNAIPQLREAGFTGYLIKPVRADSLAAQVTNRDATPERAGADAMPADPETPSRPRARPGLAVLVAEDNEINALLATSLLTQLGHRPIVVGTGDAAVEGWVAAQSRDEPYDLLLMDLQMPRGAAASRRSVGFARSKLRRRVRRLPIFASPPPPSMRTAPQAFAAGWMAFWSNRSIAGRSAGPGQGASAQRTGGIARVTFLRSVFPLYADLIFVRKPDPPARLQLAQRDLFHQMVLGFLQDEVGALARRQDILMQIDEINATPDGSGGLSPPQSDSVSVTVEIGFRIAERRATQREKPIHIPIQQHVFVGIEIDREIEKIRDIGDRLTALGGNPACSTLSPRQ